MSLLIGQGHTAIKSRENGAHAEGSFALNALLQQKLPVDPGLGKWPLPLIDIHHALPGQMSRSCEETSYLFVSQAFALPYALPSGFDTRYRQRHGHTVEGHPVNQSFPFFPPPPWHGVAKGAVIQEKTVLYLSLAGDGQGERGQ